MTRLLGGHRETRSEKLGDRAFSQGFYVTPCVMEAQDDESTIVREEVFGPVLTVLEFSDEEEVVSRANRTRFGLSAGIFTENLRRAHRVISRLQAGNCWVNDYNLAPVEMPWGGYKHSGVGRENGSAAVESWTQVKSVYVQTGKLWCPYK